MKPRMSFKHWLTDHWSLAAVVTILGNKWHLLTRWNVTFKVNTPESDWLSDKYACVGDEDSANGHWRDDDNER